jgi:hypothetical protein
MAEAAVTEPALAGRRRPGSAVLDARRPGAFFCDHPGWYALCLAGALAAAGYAAVEACKAGSSRTRWWALAGLAATQAVGMAASRRRARTAGDGTPVGVGGWGAEVAIAVGASAEAPACWRWVTEPLAGRLTPPAGVNGGRS